MLSQQSSLLLSILPFQPLVSKATEVKDEENEEFAPAVKCLCGPTLTVRGGKYSLSCVPEGENWS